MNINETSGTPNVRLEDSAGNRLALVKAGSAVEISSFTDSSGNLYYSNSAGGGTTHIDVMGYQVNR